MCSPLSKTQFVLSFHIVFFLYSLWLLRMGNPYSIIDDGRDFSTSQFCQTYYCTMNAKDILRGTLNHPSLKVSKPNKQAEKVKSRHLRANCVSEEQHVEGSEDASDYCQCQHGSCLPGYHKGSNSPPPILTLTTPTARRRIS